MSDGETQKLIPRETGIERAKPPGNTIQLPIREIDAALVQFNGDRVLAANALGMTHKELTQKITRTYELRCKWTIKAVKQRLEHERKGYDKETAIDRVVRDTVEQLTANGARILREITNLEARITKAEEARLLWRPELNKDFDRMTEEEKKDTTFYRRHAFRTDLKGGPAEEMMVREAHKNLLEEFRLERDSAMDTLHSQAKINTMTKRQNTRSAPGKTSFGSKANAIDRSRSTGVNISGSQVVVHTTNGHS